MRKRTNIAASPIAVRITEAAALASVGSGVIRKAIAQGRLRARKLGDAPRSPVIVQVDDLHDWIESLPSAAREEVAA